MPMMPRVPGKATKIAFNILGTPPNLRKKSKKVTKREQNVIRRESSLIR